MQIKTIKVGELRTNCYVVIDEKTQEAVIIDPGDEAQKILAEIKGYKIDKIIITHGHFDHIGAIDEIKQSLKARVLMHPSDNWDLEPDVVLSDGDIIQFGGINLKVIHTPGHSPGGICLYTPGHLFAGDTLFSGTCGRVDLPGSSETMMINSLQKLFNLPADTKVYPGHGNATTIGSEKEKGWFG